jgi:hypothetical protein
VDTALSIPLPHRGAVLLFLAIGAALYLTLFAVAEVLVYRNGHDNPFYKIATSDRQHYDWLVMGASHAMPLAFDTMEDDLEATAGVSILNLALQGIGPLYSDAVLERFLGDHSAGGLIYALDSFAFRDPQWNEGRLGDPQLLARTPADLTVASRLAAETIWSDLAPQALVAYLSGFPKINNSERFVQDVWESASLFDRRYRPSQAATAERIAYLFPEDAGNPEVLERYLDVFMRLLDRALAAGMTVRVIKLPVPAGFSDGLPDEAGFDTALNTLLGERGLALEDYSDHLPEARFYFDSDHLGRQGVQAFADQVLVPLLRRLPDQPAIASDQGTLPTGR